MQMRRNEKLRLILSLLIIFVIFFGILTAGLIYRDNLYNFLSKNSTEEYKYKRLKSMKSNADKNNNAADGSLDSENAAVTEFPPETTPEPEIMPPVIYIEAPKSELMQGMFDNAIEIPGSHDKIEPPPEGREIELQYGALPLSDLIPEPFAYFKDIIFLGDSVTTGFDQFRTKIYFNGENVLRDTTIIASGSYGIFNALNDISDKTIHPLLNGKQAMPEDIIAEKDAKNVCICLGLNDLTWSKTESYIAAYQKLINRIQEKSPDKNIIIMSITPVIFGHDKGSLTNDLIMTANNALLQFAQENGIMYIDYAAAIRDEHNYLYNNLSSDNYCHLRYAAYDRLVEYMLYHPIKK